MKFEMSSIINSYKSYLSIQLSEEDIQALVKGGALNMEVDFLEGATIQVKVSGPDWVYPPSWPEPNIKSV